MDKVNCNVIRDLLPLYADQVTSSDTNALVQAHLQSCPVCARELKAMERKLEIPRQSDAAVLRRIERRQRTAALLPLLLFLAAVAMVWLWPRRLVSPLFEQPQQLRLQLSHTDGSEVELTLGGETPEAQAVLEQLQRFRYRSNLNTLLTASMGNVMFLFDEQQHEQILSVKLISPEGERCTIVFAAGTEQIFVNGIRYSLCLPGGMTSEHLIGRLCRQAGAI